MDFWTYVAFLLLAVLAGAGALAILDRLYRLLVCRPAPEDVPRLHAGDRPAPGLGGPGAGRHASVFRADPGDRPALGTSPTAGAGRPRDQLDALADGYQAGLQAGSLPADPNPAWSPPSAVDAARAPVDPYMDHMASSAQGDAGDLAAVLGPRWCSRGWHDGDCCPGSRMQWGGTVGPRPYLGSL
jgi:hypothetical protein